jgi:phosphoglycolate phosphatase
MNTISSVQHICFDLDGTLTDSVNTIYESTLNTLETLKIYSDITLEQFRTKVGYHFKDIFSAFNIPVTDFDEFIAIYINNYFKYIDKSYLYPGVIETLQYLNERKIKASLCTTKLQSQADKIINYFELEKYFSIVLGRRENIADKPSAEPLLFICKELNIEPGFSMIVGDSELDIRCGKNAGALTCAAAYGYRELNLIKEENPDIIIKNITEIKTLPGISVIK